MTDDSDELIAKQQQYRPELQTLAQRREKMREAALYTYVSDVADPEARRELMEAIRATRELFLSEQ